MPAIVALLRGVNLGGHKKIAMEELRTICCSLDLANPKTYIQSGNVVFGCPKSAIPKLAARIEFAIEKRLGFRSSVILRTTQELQNIVARNPFAKRNGIEPGKLIVSFLDKPLEPETRTRILSINVGSEEIQPAERELYIYFPDGQGRSKLPAILDRTLKNTATARNWNTVLKLLQMAEELECTK
jgi:uncharacterized protein (DUF1697 family)